MAELNESTTEFFDLNDNCLDHVFKFCDTQTIVSVSKVCKRINALVTTFHFPRQTKFKYSGLRRGEDYCSVQQFTEILNCVGRYLVDLEIRFAGNIKLYELVGRTVTDRLRKLTIYEQRTIVGFKEAILPALQHPEDLKIDYFNGDFGIFDVRSIGPWPRLEEIRLYDKELSMDEFQQFIQNNPQLRKFDVRGKKFKIRLEDIVQHLVNLEELHIDQRSYNFSSRDILKLRRLTHLKRLTITGVRGETKFDNILNNASRLNGLIELKLQPDGKDIYNYVDYYEPSPQSIIGIALGLPHLQMFGISNCMIGDKTILKFIRIAKNLREIQFHDCIDIEPDMYNFMNDTQEVILFAETIEAIVGARKENPHRIDPLILHIRIYDEETLVLFYKPEISAFLELSICGTDPC